MKLEQDMRNLERQVQMLQRQLSELQQQSGSSAALTSTPRPDRESPASESNEKWLNTAAWDRVRAGMSELQVVEILGKPTAVRPDAHGRRALLYTLEIGTTGFLTGSIAFDAGKVVDVQTPRLK
jgi:hypothetical protein